MTHFATLELSNQFAFKCPIFDTEVEMRGCVILRDRVYTGTRVDTRRGCQACIRSSKCPAAEIVRRIAFKAGDATDHCSSDEKKVGRLPGDVLERIAPVIVAETEMQNAGVNANERALIRSSSERILAQITTAPRGHVEGRLVRNAVTASRSASRGASKRVTAPEPTPKSNVAQAAATGDLAAALNAS